MHLSAVIHLFTFYLMNSLNINNITSPIKLTNIFINDTSLNIGIQAGFMSYYINPNDSTNKYLWYGMYGSLNDSVSTVGGYIKSTIFTSHFTVYNNNFIQTPFTIGTSAKAWGVAGNQMCTSPVTNDVITCWIQWIDVDESQIIQCKIYYTKTNIFSDVIHITSVKNNIFDHFLDVLCFKDSYFIPWIRYTKQNKSTIVLGALLDLNGNIVLNEITLSSSFTAPYILTSIDAMKGGSKFSVQQIHASATEIFLIYCTLIEQFEFVDLPQMISIYGYYTNISSFSPINIYNESTNHITPTENAPFCRTEILNFRNNCCYLSIYTSNASAMDTDHLNVLGTVSDIYGNYITFEEYSDTQTMLLINDTAYGTNVEIVSLPMISNDMIHYFMIVYGNATYDRYDDYVAGNVAGNVYYLQWNSTEKKYHLFHENIFNLVDLVNGSASGELVTQFLSFCAYVMPETNQLFISWEQNAWDGGDGDNLNDNLYAQTFEIK